jgi:hypothetical protein
LLFIEKHGGSQEKKLIGMIRENDDFEILSE